MADGPQELGGRVDTGVQAAPTPPRRCGEAMADPDASAGAETASISAAAAAAAAAVAALREENRALRARNAALQRRLNAALLAAPKPPPGTRHFLSAKFAPGWALLLNVFPSNVARRIDRLARTTMDGLCDIRARLLLPLLFDRALWAKHPEMKGGGLHMSWDLEPDGFDGLHPAWKDLPPERQRKTYRDGAGRLCDMQGFNGVPYATLRAPMVKAFRDIQAGPAAELVDLVQGIAARMFALIPPPMAALSELFPDVLVPDGDDDGGGGSGGGGGPGHQCLQPCPPEFEGQLFNAWVASPQTSALCRDALALLDRHAAEDARTGGSSVAETLYVAPPGSAGYQFLRYRLEQEGKHDDWKMYGSFVLALCVMHTAAFHRDMKAIMEPHGDVIHGKLKDPRRAKAKTTAEYCGKKNGAGALVVRPEMRCVKDFLRVTVVVDDHRAMERALRALQDQFAIVSMKNRLTAGTHDAMCFVRLPGDGLIAEVQFSFRSVLLVKSFSHVAYRLARVDLDARGGLREMLDVAFRIPRNGAKSAGGYAARNPDETVSILGVDGHEM